MSEHANIFINIEAHNESGTFIRDTSTNKDDIREFTFNGVDLSSCQDVLDIGCASGFFTRGLAGRLHPEAHILGTDLWAGCENYFLTACRESGFTGEFCYSDMVFCKRYPDKCFDLVLCSYALYFFPDAIAEISRVLRPGGIFIAVTHAVPHMHELVEIIRMLLAKRMGRSVLSLPQEKLFEVFSNVNGLEMLSPWFSEIKAKQYTNALQVTRESLPGLIKYLCFKKPKFVPMNCGLDDGFIKGDVTDYLNELLAGQEHLTISKNDTVFVCKGPFREK